jgi:hypothetical protein
MTIRRQRVGFVNLVIKACLILLCAKLAFGGPSFGVQKYPLLFRVTLRIRGPFQSCNTFGRSFLSKCRGGANANEDEEEGEYEDEGGEDEEEEGKVGEDTGMESRTSNSLFGEIVDTLNSLSKAIMRGVGAAFESFSSGATKKDTSILKRVAQTCQSFWIAASSSRNDSESSVDETFSPLPVSQSTTTAITNKISDQLSSPIQSDFGTYLSQAYGATDGRRAQETNSTPVLGTSFNDALAVARQNARLLLVLIPSTAPKAKSKSDIKAIESFLSQQVATLSNKKARKKGETGSFVLWGTKPGSSEANQAVKRLKISPKNIMGKKVPILLVVFPSQVRKPIGLKCKHDLDRPPSLFLFRRSSPKESLNWCPSF